MNAADLSDSMLPAFRESLETTFNTMVFLPVIFGDPRHKHDGAPTGTISGTIGVSGTHKQAPNELRANFSLIFSESLAKRVLRSMMMLESSAPINIAELRDAVGELTNMTAGGVKTRMADKGFNLSLSLPTVVVGKDHYLGDSSGVALALVIPVTVNEDVFFMEINVSI